jgi:hypothetical protein
LVTLIIVAAELGMRGVKRSQAHTPSWCAQKRYVYSMWCIMQVRNMVVFFWPLVIYSVLSAKNPSHSVLSSPPSVTLWSERPS